MADARRPAECTLATLVAAAIGIVFWAQTTTVARGADYVCQSPGAALSVAPDLSALSSLTVEAGALYVAPGGDDTRNGRQPAPSGDGGPLATLGRARDLARADPAISRIVLRGGDYWLDAPVTFGPEDKGLALGAAPGETPVLHGGPRVTGWTEDADCRWSAPLPLPDGVSPGSLFADGRQEIQARWPNLPEGGGWRDGWLFAAAPPDGSEWEGNLRFRFHDGDVPPLDGVTGLTAHIVGGFNPSSQWGSDTLPVTGIDRDSHSVTTLGTAYFFTGDGSRYFLAGRQEFLDAPREWWYDPAARRMHYVAQPGARPATLSAGTLPTLLSLDGADGMSITGLTLRDGSPIGTGKVGTDTRGGGAIRVARSADVHISGNDFEDVGVAIHVTESPAATITRNRIAHVAGNAIYLGTDYGSFGRSDGALIAGNHISDVGEVYFESAGIWFQATTGARVAHNLIERAAQFGIAGGSLWGPEDAVYDAVIELNEVRDANLATADGGAIKLMGEQADPLRSVIRQNLVTGTDQLMNRPDGSFWPARYESVDEWPTPISWAIYLDGKASGVTIENNLVVRNVAGIGLNGGWSNVVRGNIVAAGSGTAIRIDDGTGRDWHPPWAEPNLISGNLLEIETPGTPVTYVYAPGHGAGYARFAGNLYAGAIGDKSFKVWPEVMGHGSYGSPADAAAAGLDEGSRVVPGAGFVDAANDDYRLRPDSAAHATGIGEFPLGRIGPAGCVKGAC
jgi:parallel beta-helix repeat protein